jgi:hypothetical protein
MKTGGMVALSCRLDFVVVKGRGESEAGMYLFPVFAMRFIPFDSMN